MVVLMLMAGAGLAWHGYVQAAFMVGTVALALW